ncbi:GNAT family N-acetyltransferase [Pikeienuella piscinae]|uniref:GNAT family N-acetyltransferase n=1 Tax=Pikeienuella piscinae TaxID=2748098 RepID=A0A7L5C0J0_9RHOB|nr:GNAT family N-acetyltransferase [Pikeienuella piscinae]QIE56903.1 GNAT family N-acetyltransferase [Pikeienuella piscinae]
MPEIEVREVAGRAQMKTFIRLPGQILRDDPNWVEPLHFERAQFFSPKHNPWFTHGEAAFFLAWSEGRAVGRISAQIDRLSPDVDGRVCGLFGALTAEPEQAIVTALLKAAEDWLRARGAGWMRGPYTLNINHEAGLLVDGFDSPPFLLMPHDPSWLGPMVEATGLAKGRDAFAYRLDTSAGLPERPKRLFRQTPPSLHVRPVDLKRWDEEVETIAHIFNESWKGNWGFVPFTREEIDAMAKEMKPLIDPGLTRIAELDGSAVGFIVMMPDINEAIGDFRGRLFPFNILRLIWRLKYGRIRGARVPLMGMLPGLEGLVGSIAPLLLIYSPEERCVERGFRELEFSWILEDNTSVRRLIEMLGAKIVKTYRFYERPLD